MNGDPNLEKDIELNELDKVARDLESPSENQRSQALDNLKRIVKESEIDKKTEAVDLLVATAQKKKRTPVDQRISSDARGGLSDIMNLVSEEEKEEVIDRSERLDHEDDIKELMGREESEESERTVPEPDRV